MGVARSESYGLLFEVNSVLKSFNLVPSLNT